MGGPAGRLARLAVAAERTVRRHAMLAGGETVLVAVSGGADSVALLHVLQALAPAWRLSLHVLHVDHGLRPDAVRDARFVQALAARLGVPAEVAAVTVGPGGSLEACARAARYAALEACADRIGATRIALGHTADDQAETVLMRLLQGAGPRGLAGIPPVRGRVIRPLLACWRAQVRAALAEAGLAWVEDPSNRDPKFLRNRIRHEVLPFLAASWGPGVPGGLVRAAALAREALEAMERTAAAELTRLGRWEGCAVTLPLPGLRALPPLVSAEVLRLAAARLGLRAPLRAWAHRGLARALAAPPPRRVFRLGGLRVEASGAWLRLAATPTPGLPPRVLPVPGCLALPEAALRLEARLLGAEGYRLPSGTDRVAFDADGLTGPLVVRGRRPGDRFQPFGSSGERRLKGFLVNARVPRWDRGRVPLVEACDRIVWVAGLRRGAAAPVTARTRRVLELRITAVAEPAAGPLES